MPRYEYVCENCGIRVERYSSVDERVPQTFCPSCRLVTAHRDFSGVNFDCDRAVDGPYYNRGLGMVVNSKKHRRQIMKEKGLEEWDGAPLNNTPKESKQDSEQRRKDIGWAMTRYYEDHPKEAKEDGIT